MLVKDTFKSLKPENYLKVIFVILFNHGVKGVCREFHGVIAISFNSAKTTFNCKPIGAPNPPGTKFLNIENLPITRSDFQKDARWNNRKKIHLLKLPVDSKKSFIGQNVASMSLFFHFFLFKFTISKDYRFSIL
jgi:hypothetical protein